MDDNFTALHNSTLTIPLVLNNTGNNLTDITLQISNLTNTSQMLPITITNESKKNISAGSTESYTINYPIAAYIAPASYAVKINASGNESGTIVSASKDIIVSVNASTSFSVPTSAAITISPGTNKSTSFGILNSGNVNISNISITQASTLKDDDNDTITLTITSSKDLSLLKPGESATIYVAARASSDIDTGNYNTTLTINSNEISSSITFNVTVALSLCKYGTAGSVFKLEIREPDSGDDFFPADNISLDLKIKNTDDEDKDVVVVADLFDATEGKFEEIEAEEEGTIEGDSYGYFKLELKLPSDLDESHDYKVYAKVYEDGNEEEQCYEENVDIDVKRESHSVIIESIGVPESVECDSIFELEAKLVNNGKNEEDVKVSVKNTELGIAEEKTLTLEKGESRKVAFSLSVPKNASEKNYTLILAAYYHYVNEEYEESIATSKILNVSENCQRRSATIVADVPKAYTGEELAITLTLFNTGELPTTYTISASGYDEWALLSKIDPPALVLEKGESGTSTIYLTPKNVTGTKTLKVKAIYDSKFVEKEISVEVGKKISALSSYQRFVKNLSNLSGLDYATINIALALIAIFLFVMLLRARK